jgi:DNA-binding LytR/AlgR family response regulator
MKPFNYVIIDDEHPSHCSVLQHFKPYPNYVCAHAFYSPGEALLFLQEHDVDLIFLDIEMPEMNGFQFLEALKKNVFVVILTAYPEKYSIPAHNYYFEKDLVFFTNKAQFSYYLPKIIARFEKMHSEKEMIGKINQLSKNEINTFPKKHNNQPILLVDILFITVIGHNIILKMKTEEELVFRMSFNELMSFLPENVFLLIHRNTIVNILNITAFSDITICVKEHHFIISTRRQEKIVEILKKQLKPLYQAIN